MAQDTWMWLSFKSDSKVRTQCSLQQRTTQRVKTRNRWNQNNSSDADYKSPDVCDSTTVKLHAAELGEHELARQVLERRRAVEQGVSCGQITHRSKNMLRSGSGRWCDSGRQSHVEIIHAQATDHCEKQSRARIVRRESLR